MKLCVDCARHYQIMAGSGHWCKQDDRVSLVTGDPKALSCESERADRGNCGPDGKLWTPIIVKQAEAA